MNNKPICKNDFYFLKRYKFSLILAKMNSQDCWLSSMLSSTKLFQKNNTFIHKEHSLSFTIIYISIYISFKKPFAIVLGINFAMLTKAMVQSLVHTKYWKLFLQDCTMTYFIHPAINHPLIFRHYIKSCATDKREKHASFYFLILIPKLWWRYIVGYPETITRRDWFSSGNC